MKLQSRISEACNYSDTTLRGITNVYTTLADIFIAYNMIIAYSTQCRYIVGALYSVHCTVDRFVLNFFLEFYKPSHPSHPSH